MGCGPWWHANTLSCSFNYDIAHFFHTLQHISEFTAIMQYKVSHSEFTFACIPKVFRELLLCFLMEISSFSLCKAVKPPPDWNYSMCRLLLDRTMGVQQNRLLVHCICTTHGFNKSYLALVY